MPDRRAAGVPPYGERGGHLPDDFADGGAYPEVHQAQYPPGFGPKGATKTGGVQVTMNASGETNYDAIVTAGKDPSRTTHTGHGELVAKPAATFERPSEDAIQAALDKTKATLLGRIDKRAGKTSLTAGAEGSAPEYIKYTPSNRSDAHASGASHRLIKMHQAPSDPLEPPKFRHKKVPRGPGSPPVPVMHSPPRSVDAKEQADWKIPPSISNWKNPKGYTIPLDKRLAADGRGLQEVQINDNSARLSGALYLAEQKAREAVETRARIQHEILSNEKAAKEDELRELAQRARVERVGGPDLEARPRASAEASFRDGRRRRRRGGQREVSRPVSRGRTRKRFFAARLARRRAPRTTRRGGSATRSARSAGARASAAAARRGRRARREAEQNRARPRPRRERANGPRAEQRRRGRRGRTRVRPASVRPGGGHRQRVPRRRRVRRVRQTAVQRQGGGIYKPTADADGADGAARDAGRASGPVGSRGTAVVVAAVVVVVVVAAKTRSASTRS